MNITYKTNPPLTSADLNALFSAGRHAPETSDWQPVLARSLVYLCAYDGERLIGFANVAWDGRAHAFLLDPQYRPLGPSGSGQGSASVSFDAESVMGHLWDATTGKLVTFYYALPPSLLKCLSRRSCCFFMPSLPLMRGPILHTASR